MLVKIREILTKMYFHMPCQTFSANVCYLNHNIQTSFWSKFSPTQGIQAINYRFFAFILHYPEAQNRVLNSNSIQMYWHVQMQMTAFTCLPSDPIHLQSPKTVQIWLKWFQKPSYMRAMISMSTRSSMCFPEHRNLLKCHILSSL